LTPTGSPSILSRFFPTGIPYGVAFVVEYEPDSVWYESSLTIGAQSLKEVDTAYHCFDHPPTQIRDALTKLGVNCPEKEKDGMLNIIDSYTTQLGIAAPEGPRDSVLRRSLKISDWSIAFAQELKESRRSVDIRDHVHIDDNFSVLVRYNDEKSVVEWVRTRALPQTRAHEELWFIGLAIGIASDSFYRNLELVCDGIFDFKSEEKQGQLEQYLRLRSMRGKAFDSSWQKLQVSEHGEVTFAQ